MQDQSRALLMNALTVPGVIRDIIDLDTKLNDEMAYTLHHVLSDLKPTAALLTLAASALVILQKDTSKPVSAKAVEIFCENILNSFGPAWLEDKDTNPDVLMSYLPEIAEDLSCLADHLQVFSTHSHDDLLESLYDILQVQAAAQADIAEEYVALMISDEEQEEEDFSDLDMDMSAYSSGNISNVITFPSHS